MRHRLRPRGRRARGPLRAPRHLGRGDGPPDVCDHRRPHHPGRASQRDTRPAARVEIDDGPRLAITAHACAPIERIDLIRNDRALATWRPKARDATLDFEDSAPLPDAAYYVRLRQTDGEYAWSTPIWVSCRTGSPDANRGLPAWNQHEALELAAGRPNDAESYEDQLLDYLAANEDPGHFHDITPVRIVDEVPGRAALFYAYLGQDREPISIRWYFEFPMPRLRLDWGWRDFGTRDGG